MKKIIINSGSTFKGGSEQVALSFIHECKEYNEIEFYVVIGENLRSQIDMQSFPMNFQFYVLSKRPASNLFTFIKSMLWYRKLENEVKPDCVIATGGHGYWKPKAPLIAGFNIPHYLYPESPYLSRQSLQKRFYWLLKKQIDMCFFKRVDAYLAQTDDVNRRIRKLMKSDNVITVANTVHSCFYNPVQTNKKLQSKENGEVRMLTLSSYYPHKNIEILNKVIPELRKRGYDNIKFVLTLPKNKFETVINKNVRESIINIGAVPIEECPSLYEEVDFLFLPTLLECFSASYAEAMIMGKPILTSDLGFAHTVCDDAAEYFDPLDAVDISNKIISLIQDEEKQKNMKDAGKKRVVMLNTAKERAEKYIEICKKFSTEND
ncbi:glycosyltransferase family 4 protein [Rhodohalobacter sp. 8-1]|uniref:glycosyltransferase family 4 protein n=1 Tax=Rhodohalobacter sp. 8-1 TaxID=3131972 RepID=UPI0030EB3449